MLTDHPSWSDSEFPGGGALQILVRGGEKVKKMPHWRKAVIKGKREGQESLKASEERDDRNLEDPQQASGFKIQSIQQVDFLQVRKSFCLKRSVIAELIISIM